MTIKDIARIANVSPSTVSKIINGKSGSIRPETRERVLSIVRQYHYSPSNYIRRISTEHSYKIALLLSREHYDPVFVQSLVSTAKQFNYYPLVCICDCHEEENKFLSFVSNDSVDALLWDPICPWSEACTAAEKLHIPHLVLGSQGFPPQLYMDFSAYGRLAAETLFTYSHSQIAFLSSGKNQRNTALFEGFQRFLTEQMISVTDSDCICYDPTRAIDLIKKGYTAAVCADHEIAISLLQQLSRINCMVPQDFSVLAITNNQAMGGGVYSSISLPIQKYGYALIDYIIQRVEGQNLTAGFPDQLSQRISPVSIGISKDFAPNHIVAVGSIHMDININTGVLPQLGQTIAAQNMVMIPGGKGLNQAIAVAKLEKEVYLIGRAGQDFESVRIFNTLSKHHVHAEGVARDPENTGHAVIHILKDGESAITISNGANSNLSIADISANRHLFRKAGFCLLSTEIPMEAVFHAATLAKRNKVKIIMKPSVVSELSDELLSMVDYFVPNEKELNLLCPDMTDYVQQCDYLLNKGVSTIILTLGERGCYLHTAEQSLYFPASDHVAVDTTGGSDAFIGALAVYLSEGVELTRAIQIALYAAGFCVSRQGVVPALIDRESLELYCMQKGVKNDSSKTIVV